MTLNYIFKYPQPGQWLWFIYLNTPSQGSGPAQGQHEKKTSRERCRSSRTTKILLREMFWYLLWEVWAAWQFNVSKRGGLQQFKLNLKLTLDHQMDESRECSSQATETMLITASTKYFIKWYVYVKILSEAQPRTILRIYHRDQGITYTVSSCSWRQYRQHLVQILWS